eukprot:Gb_19949 [translate_table: standard]
MNRLRSTPKHNQDLELRLGQWELEKGGTLDVNQYSGANDPILVEDDDEEVQLSSPRSFAQARNVVSRRTIRVPAINEEDLELRLGFTGTPTATGRRRIADRNGCLQRKQVPLNKTINLSDDGEEDELIYFKKRKHGLPSSSNSPIIQVKEIKLTCAICMDSMKEETSTVCGHIFCKRCIVSAIQFQKKCPTCRRKLSSNNIHRIYLSSSRM